MPIDAMESRTPWFVARLKALRTKRRHKHATVFKDHYSDLAHAHVHQSNDGESIAEAKKAFEAHYRKNNVDAKHYHSDNERFADNASMSHVESKNQIISYRASHAHH